MIAPHSFIQIDLVTPQLLLSVSTPHHMEADFTKLVTVIATLFRHYLGNSPKKRKIKHGKERNLLVDETANLGPQQSNPAQRNSRSPSSSRPVKRALIEF
jgi:hypothetical protein